MIDPTKIPSLDPGKIAALETAAGKLKTTGGDVAKTGADVDQSFQGLRGFYEAPEAELLFRSTTPVKTESATFGSDLTDVGSALDTFATEIKPIATKLKNLQSQASSFNNKIKGDDNWTDDGGKVDENNQILHDINGAVVQLMAAERKAANAIEAAYGGTRRWHAGGSAKDPNAYGVNSIPDNVKLKWGSPEEKSDWIDEFRHWVGNNIVPDWGWAQAAWGGYSGFMKGFWYDGVWGTLKGLYTLTPDNALRDPSGFLQAWKGLGMLGADAAIWSVPALGGVLTSASQAKVLPKPAKDVVDGANKTGVDFLKGLVAWDMWSKDPARASGSVTFNVLSILAPGPKGGGAMAKLFGGVGKDAPAVAVVDDAARAGGTADDAAKGAGAADGLDPGAKVEMPTAGQLADDLKIPKFDDLPGAGNDLPHVGGDDIPKIGDDTPSIGAHDPTPPAGAHDPVPPAGSHDPVPPGGVHDPAHPTGVHDPASPGAHDPAPPAGTHDPSTPGSPHDPASAAKPPSPRIDDWDEALRRGYDRQAYERHVDDLYENHRDVIGDVGYGPRDKPVIPDAYKDHVTEMKSGSADSFKNPDREASGWNDDFRGKYLKPNHAYVVDDRYLYLTDDVGRVHHAEGWLDYDWRRSDEYSYRRGPDQLTVGKYVFETGDRGGHIFGAKFLGPGERGGMHPMEKVLNGSGPGSYGELENVWEEARGKAFQPVHVKFDFEFPDASVRPHAFDVEYRVADRPPRLEQFDNPVPNDIPAKSPYPGAVNYPNYPDGPTPPPGGHPPGGTDPGGVRDPNAPSPTDPPAGPRSGMTPAPASPDGALDPRPHGSGHPAISDPATGHSTPHAPTGGGHVDPVTDPAHSAGGGGSGGGGDPVGVPSGPPHWDQPPRVHGSLSRPTEVPEVADHVDSGAHPTSHAPVHDPGLSPGHTPVHDPGHAPGHASGHDPGHTPAAHAPHDPAIPGRVDDHGTYRFETDEAGEAYGERDLGGTFDHDLSDAERHAVTEYTRHSWPYNPILRAQELGSTPAIELHKMLSDPGARMALKRTFGGKVPTLDDIYDRIRLVDQATGHPLPHGVEAIRGLRNIDFMKGYDGHDPASLIGKEQHESAIMSTALGKTAPPIDDTAPTYRLHLDLPKGYHGLWLGKRSIYPSQRELVLPSKVRYVVTRVQVGADGKWDLYAKALP